MVLPPTPPQPDYLFHAIPECNEETLVLQLHHYRIHLTQPHLSRVVPFGSSPRFGMFQPPRPWLMTPRIYGSRRKISRISGKRPGESSRTSMRTDVGKMGRNTVLGALRSTRRLHRSSARTSGEASCWRWKMVIHPHSKICPRAA